MRLAITGNVVVAARKLQEGVADSMSGLKKLVCLKWSSQEPRTHGLEVIQFQLGIALGSSELYATENGA